MSNLLVNTRDHAGEAGGLHAVGTLGGRGAGGFWVCAGRSGEVFNIPAKGINLFCAGTHMIYSSLWSLVLTMS